ncbi:unnamed protein product [Alternaria alternata]
MDSNSAKSPITIDNEGESSWCKQAITRKARSSIPDQFEKIPRSETLEFSHCEILGPTVLANLPQETSPMALAIGIFDNNLPYMRQTVYAFVHGSKHNLVGFFLIKQDFSVYRIPHTGLRNIDFVEPFCDLGDQTVGQKTVCNRLRAIILYYLLEAGHIRGFGHYRDFWQDFTKSCAWIANKGSPPKLQMDVQRGDSRPALNAALVPVPNAVVSTSEDVAFKKRKGDERSDSAPPNIKRRDYGHTIQRPIIISRSSSPENPVMAKRMEAQPRTSKAENDLLKAAIATQTRPLEVNQARV